MFNLCFNSLSSSYNLFVKKKKAKQNGPGKTKTIFSINGNNSFMLSLTPNGAKKSIINSPRQTVISNIWQYADEEDKYFLEKFFWENEEILKSDAIFLKRRKSSGKIVINIVGKKIPLNLKIKNTKTSREFEVNFIDEAKINEKDIVLYDSIGLSQEGDKSE
ncbi:hypothetical protein BVX95_00900 [archaeon D22]|nr:hypothetical protein BVX95_00900 [archaeon D22]